jgi:hypothetical protein
VQRAIACVLSSLTLLLLMGEAFGQTYPAKVIRIVVPFSARWRSRFCCANGRA